MSRETLSPVKRQLTIRVEEREDGKLLLTTVGTFHGDYERREIDLRHTRAALAILDAGVNRRQPTDTSLMGWVDDLIRQAP